MKVFIIELVENVGTESQVAQVSSSLEKAMEWMRDYGTEYGGFTGYEIFSVAHYSVMEHIIDGDITEFAGHGNYTVSGSIFV